MRTMTYIKGQWEWIACQTGIITLINLVLLTSTPLAQTLGEIFYLDLLLIVVAVAGYFFHFRRLSKAYVRIRQAMAQDEDISFLFKQSRVPEGNNVPEIALMEQLLDHQDRLFSEKENDYQQKMNDLKDYLTQTVHDLKVNLSVCDMVVRRLDTGSENEGPAQMIDEAVNETIIEMDIVNKLLFQIEQMKFRVNQALAITRANHYSEDIAAEKVDLEQVVKAAINDNAEFFIYKGISIRVELKPYHLVSDKKWIHYIVTQILNNCSKYTGKNGEIDIFSREDAEGYHLHLRDNGIGIPQEEIGRIFDKGFTGSNGRNNTKSTGMGMYYAKKMAGNLGIGLNVSSKQGKYTEFILSFYKLSDYLQRQCAEAAEG